MRKLLLLSAFGVAALPWSPALAQIPAGALCPVPSGARCKEVYDKKEKMGEAEVSICDPSEALQPDDATPAIWDDAKCDAACKPPAAGNCFVDDVFVLNGEEQYGGKPVINCTDPREETMVDPMTMMMSKKKFDAACSIDYATAAQRVVELAKMKGAQVPAGGWDQVVFFMADAKSSPENGPLFSREGKTNLVTGIGPDMAMVAKDPMKPWVGYVDAGSTGNIGDKPWESKLGACGKAPKNARLDAPSKATEASICAPGFYSFFDALAQATAALYGPYLKDLSAAPLAKSAFFKDNKLPAAGGALRSLR
jgi:hypothetical protein